MSVPGMQEKTVKDCLEYFKNIKEIQVDTETTGFDPYEGRLLLLQLGTIEDQFVINCTTTDIKLFKDFFLDDTKLFLLHNAKFDLKWLIHNGVQVANVYDTFLAECVLTTGVNRKALRVSLDKMVADYLGLNMDKAVRARINANNFTSEEVVRYAAADVEQLERLKIRQLAKIEKEGLERTLQLENEVVKVFAKMELNGVLIDQEKWLSIADKVENDYLNYEKNLDELVKHDPRLKKYYTGVTQGNLFGAKERSVSINWDSPKQKLEALQKLEPKLESVAEPKLQKFKIKHPIIKKVIEYSKSKKLGTAFGRNFLKFVNPVTQRIHTNVWQILTTGRISVSEPNLNQIPSKGNMAKEIRSCFVVPKGYKIVGGDFSGMELRIIAEFSKDPLWVNTFKEGGDLHAILASKTFGIPLEDVRKPTPFKPDWSYREVQKTVNFGLAYGMSKFKLADTVDISEEQADEIIKQFFKIVPDVEAFLNMMGNYGKQRGYIKTFKPYSRRRIFTDWKGPKTPRKALGEIERASKNQPIQGSNGDIIKQALVDTQKAIDDNDYPVKILMAVYDEIQTECREDFAEEWKQILEKIMIKAAQIVIKNVPIEVDCKINDYWSK